MLSFIVLMAVCSNIFAAVGEVKRIYPGGSGEIYFQIKNDTCNAAYKYYYFDGATIQGKNWYSLLLASASAGKAVAVTFVGDDAVCNPSVNKQIRYIYTDY